MRPNWLQSIMDTVEQHGLNLVGITDGSPYETLLSGCQSAVVLANGGRKLWDSFVEDLRLHPKHLQEHQHPFDDFVHRILLSADPDPPSSRRWIRCELAGQLFSHHCHSQLRTWKTSVAVG